ncbi:MAG: chemotaxis protein CheA [Gammaproteobacteria bacterium]|nr:MAG: chemotaxis protein CheA [Gammaproteobacteria bacterium]
MNIDVTQFHQVFFEESLEGLDTMESILLQMESGEYEDEDINAIFRVAHSIKGGAGTFGFAHISEFTHVQETLLDEIREGRRLMTPEIITLLLSAVDTVREMISISKDKEDIPEDMGQEIIASLTEIMNTKGSEVRGKASNKDSRSQEDPSESSSDKSEDDKTPIWQIKFAPHKDMLRTGNDPVRMISALEDLGKIEVIANTEAVPPLTDIDPEACYMSWVINLDSKCEKSQIIEVFEWVEDECDLEIIQIERQTVETDAKEQPGSEVVPVERRAGDRRKQNERRKSETGRRKTDDSSSASSIRVGTDKIDELINMVGELVITQSMLGVLGEDFDMSKVERLQDGLTELERHTRQLQESIMRIRMVPINFVFSRFPRMVHDLSQKLGKKIDLRISGESTELDKTVVEQIGDPLTHLVRNSVDHGVELPDERAAAGKPEVGEVHLNAYHKGGSIIIEISDDGAGLNTDKILQKAIDKGIVDEEELPDSRIHELIFHPGFSTADEVSDISGRGVGMDVVRKNIIRLGGNIEIKSKREQGSIFRISLPLTLAILDGQIISVGSEKYVVPIASIIESIQVKPDMVNKVSGKGEVFELRGEYVPILRMHAFFGIKGDFAQNLENGILVVVEGDGKKCGLFVDQLLGQQQIVIKSLETNFVRIQGLSGATIFGDGSVALILDIPGMVRQAIENHKESA